MYQYFFAIHFRVVAQEELNAADQEKNIGIAVLSFISLVTLVFHFFVRNALSVIRVSEKCSMKRCKCANKSRHSFDNPFIQIFAKEVMEKVRLLDTEKMKTEKAFHDFLPKTIIRDLKRKRVYFHRKVIHTECC